VSARPPLYPPRDLFAGSLREFTEDKLGFILRAHARFGDTVRLRMTAVHTIMVSDPADVQRVLADNYKNYKKPFVYRVLRLLVGNGLITADGDEWLKNRRTLQPGFHRQHMHAMVQTMVETAREECDALAVQPSLPVFDAMMRLTLRIAGLTLVSVDLARDALQFGDAFVRVLEYFDYRMATPLAPPSWVPTTRNRELRAAVTKLREMGQRVIAERKGSRGDLLDLLLAAKDPETGASLGTVQIVDEVLTMLLAGHETTATTLAWALYFLTQHPAHAARVYDEVRAVLGDRAATAEDLAKLTFTEAFLKETMRVRPPVWLLQRRAAADDVLGGFRIRRGDFVVVSPWAVHRRAASWTEPERFDPARFLGDAQKAIPRFAYIPFSGGPRKCIGDMFATLEATAVLATLLQRLRFTLPAGAAVRPEPLVTLRPSDGLTMGVERAPLSA
jgi:cytochrome P450